MFPHGKSSVPMVETHYLHLDHNALDTEPVWPSRHILELAVSKTLPESSNIYTPWRQETQEQCEREKEVQSSHPHRMERKNLYVFTYNRHGRFAFTMYTSHKRLMGCSLQMTDSVLSRWITADINSYGKNSKKKQGLTSHSSHLLSVIPVKAIFVHRKIINKSLPKVVQLKRYLQQLKLSCRFKP